MAGLRSQVQIPTSTLSYPLLTIIPLIPFFIHFRENEIPGSLIVLYSCIHIQQCIIINMYFRTPCSLANLDSHDAFLVILCKVADELQQLLTLLLAGPHPAPLYRATVQSSVSTYLYMFMHTYMCSVYILNSLI